MDDPQSLNQPVYPSGSTHNLDAIQTELREQRKLIEENHTMLKSLRRLARVSSVFSFIRILLIAVPLILLAIFLPPLIRDWMQTLEQYQQAVNGTGTMPQGFDLQQIQEMLQKSGMFER